MKPLIAPSLLSADFLNLGDAIDMINRSEADWIHCDVMDGVFVPNISFGLPIVKAVKKIAQKPLDVHLMIEKPERYIADFKEAGADLLSVHIEASVHLHRTLQQIRNSGMKAGVVINPHTPVSQLDGIMEEADFFLLMSVNPGFGGQKFIEGTLRKIGQLKESLLKRNLDALIEVDGGIGLNNAAALIQHGADVLVAGNAIFSSDDPENLIKMLKTCCS